MILSLSVINEMAFLLPIEDFIYHTVLILNYAIFYRLIKTKMIRLALSILAFYSVVMFGLDVMDKVVYTDFTWKIIQSFSSLYEFVYYSTITLIFAGLAMRFKGGHRGIRTSDHLFPINNHNINYLRV